MGAHITAGQKDAVMILDAIRRVVGVLRVGSRAAERRVGLSGAQLFVLQKLANGPARSLNELAERTRTHQSSVSVVVQRLVEQKLVAKAHAKTDARQLELSLTAKARAIMRRAPDAAQERLIAAIDRMPAKDRKQLATSLTRMVDAMGAAAAEAPMFFEETSNTKRRSPKRGRA
jgi:DNA-binding MarR family transcriptional regulator